MDSEASFSTVLTKTKFEALWWERQYSFAKHVTPTSIATTLVKRRNRYVPREQSNFKNSLSAGVGFLELGNAGDFAANIWNQIPVPIHAIVLMSLGGTLALCLSYFAFSDLILSWRSLNFLREERRVLQGKKRSSSKDRQVLRDLNTRLSINLRDIGTEIVNRIIMDALMGFGAVVIGVGTLMAIGGANPHVFRASNLLTGYIGNVPVAVYALMNAVWCAYMWMSAHRCSIAKTKVLGVKGLGLLLQRRARNMQIFAFTYGLSGICGAIGSLLTATRWWGYVILIPVIISSISCNYIWRRKIGYDRPPLKELPSIDRDSLVQDLKFVSLIRQELRSKSPLFSSQKKSNAENFNFVIDFITNNDLFEGFSMYLLNDTDLSSKIFGDLGPSVTVSVEKLLKADTMYIPRILEIAQTCIREIGPAHFQCQERYLLDILSYFLTTPDALVAGKAIEMV